MTKIWYSTTTTTNSLLAQLISLMVMENGGTNNGDISLLPVPPAYLGKHVWFQDLAHATLYFSLLASFGAVVGKQWVSYRLEIHRYRFLEEPEKNRQKNILEGLEAWHFNAVLQLFAFLASVSWDNTIKLARIRPATQAEGPPALHDVRIFPPLPSSV